ncbi:hypothetical protein ACF0H5_012311 [Mactra antiquata]
MAKITPRMEKRLKWFEEKKSLSRVTRARTAQQSASPSTKSVPATSSSSSTNESKTKNSPTQGYKSKSGKQPPVLSKQTDIKSSSDFKPPTKKPKLERNGDIPVEDISNGAKDKVNPKKGKIQYVDAVEKLECSSSVHVPKKLDLFVGNLPEDITKEQVMNHFRRTGGVKSVKIPKYRGTETGKGFAYVEFNSTISHRIALRLNNTTLAGRKIIVEFKSEGKMTEKQLNEKMKQKTDGETLKMPFDT